MWFDKRAIVWMNGRSVKTTWVSKNVFPLSQQSKTALAAGLTGVF